MSPGNVSLKKYKYFYENCARIYYVEVLRCELDFYYLKVLVKEWKQTIYVLFLNKITGLKI